MYPLGYSKLLNYVRFLLNHSVYVLVKIGDRVEGVIKDVFKDDGARMHAEYPSRNAVRVPSMSPVVYPRSAFCCTNLVLVKVGDEGEGGVQRGMNPPRDLIPRAVQIHPH